MGGPGKTRVLLPAKVKTEILWTSFAFKTYHVSFGASGVSVSWERNSTLPPWHTSGTLDSSHIFNAVVAGVYCNFWMTSPVTQQILIE